MKDSRLAGMQDQLQVDLKVDLKVRLKGFEKVWIVAGQKDDKMADMMVAQTDIQMDKWTVDSTVGWMVVKKDSQKVVVMVT